MYSMSDIGNLQPWERKKGTLLDKIHCDILSQTYLDSLDVNKRRMTAHLEQPSNQVPRIYVKMKAGSTYTLCR